MWKLVLAGLSPGIPVLGRLVRAEGEESVWGRKFGQNEQTLGGDKGQVAFSLLPYVPFLPGERCWQLGEKPFIFRL